MPNTRNTTKSAKSVKSLNLSTIKSVDEQGAVVADAMTQIGNEVRADASLARKSEAHEISRKEITLESWNTKVLVRVFSDGKIYVGPEHLSVKWHINDHFAIMGFYNSIGGVRRGHYAVVEEGIHLKYTMAEAYKRYEGRLGYINFANPGLDPKWVEIFAKKGLTPREGTDTWLAVDIVKNGGVKPAFLVKPETLDKVAAKLEKTIDQLSPVTIANYQETWATSHKRDGLEALYRVVKGELCVVIAFKLAKDADKWQIGVQGRRFSALFGSLEDLAKEMDGKINGRKDQLDADQGGFVLNQAPEVLKETVAALGELTVYGGKTYTADQLAKHNVIRMVGDMEVGARIYLRDVASVAFQWAKYVNPAEGKTLKLIEAAE